MAKRKPFKLHSTFAVATAVFFLLTMYTGYNRN